jgi:aryl-alcohol dehydrogenase-like predicted oxidoreductase
VLSVTRELGIGFVPYAPLGRGFLTGQLRSVDDLAVDDSRRTSPRFMAENFQQNLRVADEVQEIAAEVGATPAQVAIAWLLARATTSPRFLARSVSRGSRRTSQPTPST